MATPCIITIRAELIGLRVNFVWSLSYFLSLSLVLSPLQFFTEKNLFSLDGPRLSFFGGVTYIQQY